MPSSCVDAKHHECMFPIWKGVIRVNRVRQICDVSDRFGRPYFSVVLSAMYFSNSDIKRKCVFHIY